MCLTMKLGLTQFVLHLSKQFGAMAGKMEEMKAPSTAVLLGQQQWRLLTGHQKAQRFCNETTGGGWQRGEGKATPCPIPGKLLALRTKRFKSRQFIFVQCFMICTMLKTEKVILQWIVHLINLALFPVHRISSNSSQLPLIYSLLEFTWHNLLQVFSDLFGLIQYEIETTLVSWDYPKSYRIAVVPWVD